MSTRNTIQRDLVLQTVRRLQSHPTADEVYLEVVKECPTISRATVYRNLNQLVASGEISIREMPCAANCYDDRRDEHYHARCLQCGRVFDVDMDYIPDLDKKINDTCGFEISGYDLVFKGVCPECRKKSEANE